MSSRLLYGLLYILTGLVLLVIIVYIGYHYYAMVHQEMLRLCLDASGNADKLADLEEIGIFCRMD